MTPNTPLAMYTICRSLLQLVMADVLRCCRRSETIYTDLRSEPEPEAGMAGGPEEDYETYQFDDGS